MPDWMGSSFWLSLSLAVAGVTGLHYAGKGKWYGWAIGAATQPLWVAFAITSKGYGLIITSAMYFTVYTRNLAQWRSENPRGGVQVALTKHGHGEVLKEDAEVQKTSALSEDELAALAAENADADR